jgi:hypothetical protein
MRSNPIAFVTEHPWMTFFLGLATIGVVRAAVGKDCPCSGAAANAALPATTPSTTTSTTNTTSTPAVTPGTSGLGALPFNPMARVHGLLGMRG